MRPFGSHTETPTGGDLGVDARVSLWRAIEAD